MSYKYAKELPVNFVALSIKILSFFGGFKALSRPIYRMIMKLPYPAEKRERLAVAVFGKVRVRPLSKGVARGRFETPQPQKPIIEDRSNRKTPAGFSSPLGRLNTMVFRVLEVLLRGALRLRLDFLVEGFFRIAERSNMDDMRFNEFAERVYHDRDEGFKLGQLYMAPVSKIGKRPHYTKWTQQSRDALAQASRIHVILDQKTSIPDILTQEAYSNAQFVFYSFDNLDDKIVKLGLADRSQLASLRDQFNEISPEGERLYDESRVLSRRLVNDLDSNFFRPAGLTSSRLRETLALTLDTQISTRMTLVLCVQAALSKVPASETVLMVSRRGGLITDGWEMMGDDFRKADVHFAVNGTRKQSAAFFSMLCEDPLDRLTPDRAKADRDSQELPRKFGIVAQRLRVGAVAFTDNIRELIADQNSLLLLHGQTGAPYKKTIEQLGLNLLDKAGNNNFPQLIFLHLALEQEKDVIPRLIKADQESEALFLNIATMSDLVLDNTLHPRLVAAYVYYFIKRAEGQLTLFDTVPTSIIDRALRKLIWTALPWSVFNYEAGRQMCHQINLNGILASTTRHWLTRAFCAGVMDGVDARETPNTIPIIDIQTLNSIKHPKYRIPMATHAAVIDHTQAEIMSGYLGFDESRITLAGAPQNDAIQAEVLAVDTAHRKKTIGLPANARVVTLVSQLQPMERMSQIVRPLAELIADTPNTYLVIRMHPREGSDRIESYRAALDGIPLEKVAFSVRDTSYEIVAMTDVCVTIYSNMAREMAMTGIPVTCVQYLDWAPPIDLVEEGLAFPAASPEALKSSVLDLLEQSTRAGGTATPPYLVENAHLTSGTASDRILEALIDATETGEFVTTNTDGSETEMISSQITEGERARVTLVAGSNLKIVDLPPVFDRKSDFHVFIADDSGERGMLPKRMVTHSAAYSSKNSKSTTKAVAEADAFMLQLIDETVDLVKECPSLYRQLVTTKRAMWLRQRTRIIAAFRTQVHLETGLSFSKGGKLIVCGADVETVMYLAMQALKVRQDIENIQTLIVEKSRRYTLMSLTEFLSEHDPEYRPDPGKPPFPLPQFKRSLELIENWAKEVEDRPPAKYSGRRLLITTDWRLKTVPATLTPIIKHHLEAGAHVVVFNTRPDDLQDIQFDLSSAQAGKGNLSLMSSDDFENDVLDISPRTASIVSLCLAHELAERPFIAQQSPLVRKTAHASVKSFFRPHTAMLLGLQKFCQDFLAPGKSVSVGCPGRQWHTDVAHTVAESRGLMAMTLQNAYMTAGYTYTKPTGNYVTAIDQWSKDLFIESYGVPEENIHVVSTPRFDYLRDIAALDPEKARQSLGVVQDEILVLFAAQVGYEPEAERVIRALAGVEGVDGRAVKVIAKLHPRTDPKEIARYQDVAASANPTHTVTITSDTKIYDYLAASDIVITLFSNVGTEAAILGKNLVVVNFEDEPLPVPMDLFGFSHVARNEEEIAAAVRQYCSDEEFIAAQRARVAKFTSDNPVMVEGRSVVVVNAAIEKGFGSRVPKTNGSKDLRVSVKEKL